MNRINPRFRSFLEAPSSSTPVRCDAAPQALRQLASAGVPLLAGTDAPAGVGTIWGASLHMQLETYLRNVPSEAVGEKRGHGRADCSYS